MPPLTTPMPSVPTRVPTPITPMPSVMTLPVPTFRPMRSVMTALHCLLSQHCLRVSPPITPMPSVPTFVPTPTTPMHSVPTLPLPNFRPMRSVMTAHHCLPSQHCLRVSPTNTPMPFVPTRVPTLITTKPPVPTLPLPTFRPMRSVMTAHHCVFRPKTV